jgi:hypothetical protein
MVLHWCSLVMNFMTMERDSWLKFLIALLLSSCCIFQVHLSLKKYLSDKTTMTQYKRTQTSAPMPLVVLCPTKLYRQSQMDKNNMTVFMHFGEFGKWPADVLNVLPAWLNITFPLADLLTTIYANTNGATCRTSAPVGVKVPEYYFQAYVTSLLKLWTLCTMVGVT